VIEVVPFAPAHLVGFNVQPAQRSAFALQPDAVSAPFGQAWTALADGVPVGCAGFVEVWDGRAYAWALLAAHAGPHMIALTRAIRCVLAQAPFRRVEMAVDADFPQAARWAALLGFKCETPEPMRAYLPDGSDAYLYAKVT